MSADIKPIRDGIEPECDVAREALDYVKDALVRYAQREPAAISFVLHFADGTAESFAYCGARPRPDPLLTAQAAMILTVRAASEADG